MGVYGIDLGITYSRIAKLDANGNPEVIRNQEDASDALASVVYFESENDVVVGEAAKDYIETDGDHVVQYAKRYIGKTNDKKMGWAALGRTYSPIEICSIILKRLKQIAEDHGETVEDVVITCPAYFGGLEWNAIREAGELAGLNVINQINEPMAAALYYTREVQKDETILVYDLGGSTFDVTILDMKMITNEGGIKRPRVMIVDSDGIDSLGGKDWDAALYQYIMDAVLDDTGLSIEDIESETKQDIRNKVERTKIKLSKKESVKIKIGINGAITNIGVSREEFKRITSNLVQKTLSYVDVVLQRNFDCVIDTVLLVGGSTYMPMIREAVENKFPGKVQQHKPDCAVAMGAAIYGGYLEKELIKKSEFIDGCIEDEDEVFLKNQLERTQERLKEIERERKEGALDFLFVEEALLIENGYLDIVDEMWYIYALENVRRRRLIGARNYSDEKVTSIMKSQLSEEEFKKHCKVVIDNSGELAVAYKQVDKKLGEYLYG